MAADINVRELAALVRTKRGLRGLRTTAQEIGVSAATLSRVEQGKAPDLDTLTALCRWLETSPNSFLVGERSDEATDSSAMPHPPGMSTPEVIAAHLRADKDLPAEAAETLAAMIRLTYEAVTRGERGKGKPG
jgi:transcriptional regulator with XRE-family HTH domain